MSDQFWINVIANLPATLVALAALIKVFYVHKELNGRLDEWKEETKRATIASNTAAKAEGVKEQKDKNEITVPVNTIKVLPSSEKDKT